MTVTRNQRLNYETNDQPRQLSALSPKIKALTTCQGVFGKELTEDEGRIWREFLEPIPSWLVTKAFLEWARTERFFPKPAQILDLIQTQKGQNRAPFVPCERNGCTEGWVHVYEGRTMGALHGDIIGPIDLKKPGAQQPVDKKLGAVRRCQCWHEYLGK